MDRDRFEADVIALAAEGVPLTVANVSARTRLSPRQAEPLLDDMVRSGHLESEVDEREGLIVYRARGLSAAAARARVTTRGAPPYGAAVFPAAGEVLVRQATGSVRRAIVSRPAGGKNVLVAAALGGVFGPLGLAYAAPWPVVLVSLLCYGAASSIPIVRAIFHVLVVFIHLGFAIAGALYAMRYNQAGARMPLLPQGE